jgi:ABC-type transport system involved in cytochrome bd biosynthesis fused ATPase/permease subunit
MEDASFSWGGEDGTVLRDINLRIQKGSLVAVVGAVGTAKSSLLSAMLGEMDKLSGRVNTQVVDLNIHFYFHLRKIQLRDQSTLGFGKL